MSNKPPKRSSFVSVVVPILRNYSEYPHFLYELDRILNQTYQNYEILAVDGEVAAVDSVIEAIRSLANARYIKLMRPLGVEVAIAAGLDSAIGHFVVIVNLGIDPIEVIPEMVDLCQKGSSVVYGVESSAVHLSIIQRFGRGIFSWLCRKIFHFDWPYNVSYFLCLSRQVVGTLIHQHSAFMCVRADALAIGSTNRPFYFHRKRNANTRSRRNLVQNIRFALSIISHHSIHPLRLATWLGISAILSNTIYIFYILAVWLFKDNVQEGWISSNILVVSHFLLFSIILTIFSEYFAAIISRLIHKPLYAIAEEHSGKEVLGNKRHGNIVNSPGEEGNENAGSQLSDQPV
jgi:polyisoprenyl-phosphate glycosyltransferase